MRRALLAATLLLPLTHVGCAVADGSAAQPALVCWTTHAMDKVRPSDPPGSGRAVALSAARNEFEAFQVLLRAEGGGMQDVDVRPLPLRTVRRPDDDHAPLPLVTTALVRHIDVVTPSSLEGAAGPWPDVLIPRVDAYLGEERNAFPFDLTLRRNQAVWVEVYVPRDAAPGSYLGQVEVTVGGRAAASIPVSLHVWPFTLPSTSSFRSSFGFSALEAVKQHLGRYTDDADLRRLNHLYAMAALRHRISLHGGTMIPPRGEELDAPIPWADYDAEVGPFLDGTVFGDGDPLPGARVTSIDLRLPSGVEGPTRRRLLASWAEHFREKGWLDRLFVYLKDEPTPDDYPEILTVAGDARRADRGIRLLATEAYAPPLARAVDIWAPPINSLDTRPGVPPTCGDVAGRDAYAEAEARGAEMWWYQSCCSHGCGETGGDPFRGWPSYVIDAPAMAHRILPWLAFTYRIEGELYYNTVESFGRVVDPFQDTLVHGGNGDGTLFYPGTPDRIGGTSHVPLESLRLKIIREGYEDHEYLALLASAGAREAANIHAQRIGGELQGWEHRPEALYAAREAIAREIVRARAVVDGGSP